MWIVNDQEIRAFASHRTANTNSEILTALAG
jgi:hypothetical protein